MTEYLLVFYIIVSGLVHYFVFNYKDLKSAGWEKAYDYFDIGIINFVKWHKNKSVIDSSHKVNTFISYLFFVILFLLVIMHSVFKLDFLNNILILILGFCLFSMVSFNWVFNYKEESKKYFNSMKKILFVFFGIMSLMILFGAPDMIEALNQITDKDNSHLLKEIYLIGFSTIIILGVSTYFGFYIILWILLGSLPTLILLILYLLTKLAHFFDYLDFKRLKFIVSVNTVITIILAPLIQYIA